MKRLIYTALLFTSVSIYAQEDVILKESEMPPHPEAQARGAGGTGFGKQDIPIDMHTSALLVVGIGLIASYAYFARRKQEAK